MDNEVTHKKSFEGEKKSVKEWMVGRKRDLRPGQRWNTGRLVSWK